MTSYGLQVCDNYYTENHIPSMYIIPQRATCTSLVYIDTPTPKVRVAMKNYYILILKIRDLNVLE